jgi:choline monooxygenase
MSALTAAGPAALPSNSYTSEDVLNAEMERIFSEGWHCVGREDVVAEPGQFLCATVLGRSVIVARDADGVLRALSNNCRHRGMPLLEPGDCGKANRLTCPYHAWTYSLDGRLLAAPLMGGSHGLDRDPLSLRSYGVTLWRGWVFVSVGERPKPFRHAQSGLDALIAPFRPEAMRSVFLVRHTWRTNWKLLVENFIESYHVFQVHRDTIEPRTPTSSVVCGPGDGTFCRHFLTERPGSRRFSAVDESLPEELRHREVLGCVFPAHLVSATANLLVWLSLCPAGPGAVAITGGVAARPGYLRDGAERLEIEQQLRRDFDAFNAEDQRVVERLFLAHASGAVRAGPLCALEQPLWEFHEYLRVTLG